MMKLLLRQKTLFHENILCNKISGQSLFFGKVKVLQIKLQQQDKDMEYQKTSMLAFK